MPRKFRFSLKSLLTATACVAVFLVLSGRPQFDTAADYPGLYPPYRPRGIRAFGPLLHWHLSWGRDVMFNFGVHLGTREAYRSLAELSIEFGDPEYAISQFE